MEITQVCKEQCENKPTRARIGGKEYNFCCLKGLTESIQQFTASLSDKKYPNDTPKNKITRKLKKP